MAAPTPAPTSARTRRSWATWPRTSTSTAARVSRTRCRSEGDLRCSSPTNRRSQMSILMTAEVPGMTQEMVDGMTGQLMDEQKTQPGFVLHANGPIDGGWGVTEVWEAQENWDSWFEGTIKPNLPEGIEPRITTRELNDVVQP